MMKQRATFVLVVLMLGGGDAALAQQRRGFIGIGIGPSMPFGAFAADTLTARGGRATPGYIDTFLNIGYRFRDRWGVAVAASYGEYVMRDGGEDDWWQVLDRGDDPTEGGRGTDPGPRL